MIPLLLNILFVGGGALLGAGAGWWLRGSGTDPTSPKQGSEPTTKKESPKFDQVEGLLARLHQLTATVAADVGEHNSRVQEINQELTSTLGNDDGVVLIVEKLIHINEQMGEQLVDAEERLQAQADEIQSHVLEARTDALTNLFNRRGFDDSLKEAITESRRNGRPVSVMMMDVDFFKKFNDTYGHQAGDEVLKSVAKVIRKNLADKEVVCRYGGEEFAVIFPGSNVEAAKLGAERVRAAVCEKVLNFDGMDLRVTISTGLSELRPEESSDEFVKRADLALYASKNDGRNCSHWHDGNNCLRITAELPSGSPAPESPDNPPVEEEESPDRIEGISSREVICRDIDRRLGEWRRGGATASVVLLEVDKMAELTEERGEKAAAVIHRAAAQFLKATIRDMDHIAHYDETTFALLLPTAGISDAKNVAERLRRAVQRCELSVAGGKIKFTVSLGVAEVATGDERSDLLHRAETALQAARNTGNCIVLGSAEVTPAEC